MKQIHSILNRIYHKMYPEEYFIELLLRNSHLPKKKEAMPLAQEASNIRWDRVTCLIQDNQLQVVLNSLTSKGQIGRIVPYHIQKKIVHDQLNIKQAVHNQQKEFSKIIDWLTTERVEFVMMKILPYAQDLFGKEPIKVNSDLDILIPIRSYLKADQLLRQHGYTLFADHKRPKSAHLLTFKDFYIPRGEEIYKKGKQTIEFHTQLIDTTSFSSRIFNDPTNRQLTQALYTLTETKTVNASGKHSVTVFSPTSLVISLFVHLFYQHNFQSLIRYYEIGMMLDIYNKKVKRDDLFKIIDTFKLKSYFMWFLCLLNEFFPSLIPGDLSTMASDYKRSFNFPQAILFYYMKYRALHPVDYPWRIYQKKICWALIDRRVIYGFYSRIKVFWP